MTATNPVVFVCAACDEERAARFLTGVSEAHAESKDAAADQFAQTFTLRLRFKMLLSSPFTFLGEDNTKVMGYEDPSHAQHVSRLHGWPVENLRYIQMELSAEAAASLQEQGAIKNVSQTEKKIWSIDPFVMLALTEPDLKLSIKTRSEVGL